MVKDGEDGIRIMEREEDLKEKVKVKDMMDIRREDLAKEHIRCKVWMSGARVEQEDVKILGP